MPKRRIASHKIRTAAKAAEQLRGKLLIDDPMARAMVYGLKMLDNALKCKKEESHGTR